MNIEHVIAYSFQDSLFPEIIECFGLERAVQFVKIFGGTTIEVPSADAIQHAMRDFDIYQRLKVVQENRVDVDNLLKKMSNEYFLTTQEVQAIFATMTALAESKIDDKIRGWKSRNQRPRINARSTGES